LIADLIGKILSDVANEKIKQEVKHSVKELCTKFPLYA